MRKLILVSFVAIVAMMMNSCCGCGGAKSKNPYTLTSTNWQLIEMNNNKITATDDSFTITFNASEGKVNGRGDCNNFFAEYVESDVRKLKFSNSGSTKMFCQNQNLEDEYLKILNEIDSYTIDGDVLLLQKNGEVKLIFNSKK